MSSYSCSLEVRAQAGRARSNPNPNPNPNINPNPNPNPDANPDLSTGKTYTVKQIVEGWRRRGKRVVLACPTARAATVLASTASWNVQTPDPSTELAPYTNMRLREVAVTVG